MTRWVAPLLGAVLSMTTAWAADDIQGDALTQARTLDMDGRRYGLTPIPDPDLSATEPVVQTTLRETRASLARMVQAPTVSAAELAAAFGKLGEIYHAHHIYIPAEPAYVNASSLAPDEFAWPYLLGYLAEQTTRAQDAVVHFRRALEIDPGSELARLRLAQAWLELNRPGEAAPLLETPFRDTGLQAAVDFARGRLALQNRDYAQAARLLERVLAAQPHASRAYSPLGMAYRGLGETDRARKALASYGDGKPKIPDPWVDRLEGLLSGGRTQLHRGLVAIQEGQYEIAAQAFGTAVAAEPDNINVRVSYARSLFLMGDADGARRELAEALRRDPMHPMANFIIGVLDHGDGELAAARAHYLKVLEGDPLHAGAHHFLGDILMQDGDYGEAARHYAASVEASPQDSTARLLLALTLLRSGAPHTEVEAQLETGMRDSPEHPMFAHLLARMLAASPQPEARDGERALALADTLMEQSPGPANAEIRAMAYAELGRYDDAVTEQNGVIAGAFMTGRFDLMPQLQTCLEHYQDHQPCRSLWKDDDPLFSPPPMDPARPVRDYPTAEPY